MYDNGNRSPDQPIASGKRFTKREGANRRVTRVGKSGFSPTVFIPMDTRTYPGKGLSLSQLVFALNEELKHVAYSSLYVATDHYGPLVRSQRMVR